MKKTAYIFDPRPDLTAYELVQLHKLLLIYGAVEPGVKLGDMPRDNDYLAPQVAALPEGARRHIRVEECDDEEKEG